MINFPKYTFEPENFRQGKSGNIYDLSVFGLKNINKTELIDLLSNDIFWLNSKKISRYSRTLLLKILNNKLKKLYKPENIELFWLKDPRKTELTDEEKEKYKIENFPKHIWIWLPHWTYQLPKITKQKIFQEVKNNVLSQLDIRKYSNDTKKLIYNELQKFYRIIKNFSDHWTTNLVDNSKLIPNNQVFKAKYSRATTDPARSISENPMDRDFYWNKLNEAIKSSYKNWILQHAVLHLKINEFLNESIEKYWWTIFIDRHDTWVNDIDKNPKLDKYNVWGFPIISLWTLDWESCNPEILEYYAERIEYHLWVKPLINKPYKGWYITQKFGRARREELKKQWKNPKINNVIQVEVLKSLYLDEETQIIYQDKAEWIWIWLARAEIDLWIKFWKKYFKWLK